MAADRGRDAAFAAAPASGTVATFDLEAYLAQRRPLVETELARLLDHVGAPEPLGEAMRYALLGEGKRLRPLLTIAAAEAVSRGNLEARIAAMDLGCAVEMIHAYSLVHDDLPAMDDDDLRRGRPTVHKAFDQATAILAGDALQALAFRTAATADALKGGRRAVAVAVLAKASGANGMVGGQVLDLAAEGRFRDRLAAPGGARNAIDLPKLERLAAAKTGALIAAAAELGAIAAGARLNVRKQLRAYGAAVGLAFQITDDLLDAEGSAEEVGKATHKDASKGKVTFPGLLGNEEARRKAVALADEAAGIARKFANDGGRALVAIAQWAVHRRK